MKIAVFPGSFDPVTNGHVDIVRRALPAFDEIIVAIGNNTEKKYYYPLGKRKQWIEEVFSAEKKIRVISYEGLTVDFCRKHNAAYILRGLRSSADFEYERMIAGTNLVMAPDIETVFLIAAPAHASLSSTIIREIAKNRGDISAFVPFLSALGD